MSAQPSLFSRVPSSLSSARARRDRVMDRPTRDPEMALWVSLATAHVEAWAWQHHADRSTWLIEDARSAFEEMGLTLPRDPRWWGAVTRALVARRVIVAEGWQAAKSSNCSPKRAWRLR